MRSAPLLVPSAFALLTLLASGAGCSDSTETALPPPPAPDASTGVYGPLGQRSDLPVDQRSNIEHLSAPVDVVRDKDGRPHIYASNVVDAVRVEGFLVAQDRALQLELLRRNAQGRVAELFGNLDASTIDSDIAFRTIGLARVAKREYDALPAGEMRDMLDAYADGVTQLFRKIRSEAVPLPAGISFIPLEAFTDWTGADSLTIAKLQSYLLSYDSDTTLRLDGIVRASQTKFVASSPDPLFAKRAGFERDFVRFAPSDPTFTTHGYPGAARPGDARPGAARPGDARAGDERTRVSAHRIEAPAQERRAGTAAAISAAEGYLDAVRKVNQSFAPAGFGSNGWIVGRARSATGQVLLASDPHLALGAPATFWPVSIDAPSLKVSGVAFPGVPGIILGHNERIAWGATVAFYQTTDVYAEKLSPDGKGVTFAGSTVPLQTVDEVIGIAGGGSYTYHVKIVPHHGPILPTIKDHRVADPDPIAGALSVKWTGLVPTENFGAIALLQRARTVDEARSALDKFTVGAQNWMIGDVDGNILWTSHASIPIRDPRAFAWNAATYTGRLPCFILPGDDGTAEWRGYLADGLVPWAKNPSTGYLVTANNDPIGDTADNDPSNGRLPDGTPMFLSSSYDIGFRQGRITKLLEEHAAPLSPEDFAAIQADVRSSLGARLTPEILRAIDAAEAERTHTGPAHADLSKIVADPAYDPARIAAVRAILQAWGDESDYRAASGFDPTTNKPLSDEGTSPEAISARASRATMVFNIWLTRMLERTFGDELGRLDVKSRFPTGKIRSLLYLMTAEPSKLATYDGKDSAIWDDMNTPDIESRQERIIRALLDALAWLGQNVGGDIKLARWGAFHTIRFDALVPLFTSLSIPPGDDPLFPHGFPRPGDLFAIDSSDFPHEYPVTSAPSFQYTGGPAQRFVASLDPAGPRAWNALPGGAIWDAKNPHFRDQAELWRKNQTHLVPFALADVVAAKESRTVVSAP